MSSSPLKFNFDTAFGTHADGASPVVQEIIITQDDVDQARTQGFVQGREEGLNEANAQVDQQQQAFVQNIDQKLQSLIANQAPALNETQDIAKRSAYFVASKIADRALSNYPADEIKHLIDECLSFITQAPHLVVRVNSEYCEMTQQLIDPIIAAKGYEGKLIILGEDDILNGDCVIEWADGGVSQDRSEILRIIENNIAGFFDDAQSQLEAEKQEEWDKQQAYIEELEAKIDALENPVEENDDEAEETDGEAIEAISEELDPSIIDEETSEETLMTEDNLPNIEEENPNLDIDLNQEEDQMTEMNIEGATDE